MYTRFYNVSFTTFNGLFEIQYSGLNFHITHHQLQDGEVPDTGAGGGGRDRRNRKCQATEAVHAHTAPDRPSARRLPDRINRLHRRPRAHIHGGYKVRVNGLFHLVCLWGVCFMVSCMRQGVFTLSGVPTNSATSHLDI